MCTLKLIILLQLCVVQAIWANSADGENLHAEAAALPYSLKTSSGNKNDERYKLLAMNTLNDQTADHELVETNNRNNLHKRRSGDAWDRISLHYKTQLSQVNPGDDFGYYNLHSVAPHTFPADVSHFGVETATSLPLVLMLIVNVAMLFYSFIGILSALPAATGGLNFRLPYHPYLRREESENKYN